MIVLHKPTIGPKGRNAHSLKRSSCPPVLFSAQFHFHSSRAPSSSYSRLVAICRRRPLNTFVPEVAPPTLRGFPVLNFSVPELVPLVACQFLSLPLLSQRRAPCAIRPANPSKRILRQTAPTGAPCAPTHCGGRYTFHTVPARPTASVTQSATDADPLRAIRK